MTSGAPPQVVSQVAGPVAEIGLANGPLNLVTKALLLALDRALREIEGRSEVRCLILHGGSGRVFCAGSDLKEVARLHENASEHKILFEDMVLRRLAAMPMPTIAAIDGPALGGGLELALACDLRVCAPNVTLGLTEGRIGGLAGSGAVRLARLVGPARAKELLFTADTISTDRALSWGLVNQVVVEGTALDGARRLAATIATRGPLSNRLAKRLVEAALDVPIDAALSLSTSDQQRIYDSHDLHEGVAAFFAKREPQFTGA